MKFILLLLALVVPVSIWSQTPTNGEKEWEMKQYYMVFLIKGPNRNQDSATAATIQKAHLENIGRLHEAKKLAVAGPFLDDQNMRGIFIFDVATEKEVIDLLNTDPAIISGRLIYEIHPWMTGKGNCFE
jgi:uncharacterized protein YciI